MSSIRDRKEFDSLDFQVWIVRDENKGKWRSDVYIIGSNDALGTIRDSLQGLLDVFQTYGKGTRKYKCNPPADFDHIAYGRKNNVTIRWLETLVVRLGFDAMDNEPFILEDYVVTLNVNPNTLKVFINRIGNYIHSPQQYGHGAEAVCGLRFSPDWLGIE